jgi:hypothetical protein
VQHLVAVELHLRGDDEGRELDLAVAGGGDVVDDGAQLVAAQAVAGDLAPQRRDRRRRLGVFDAGRPALGQAQAREGVLGQARSQGATMRSSSTTLSTAAIAVPLARMLTLDRAWKPSARTTGQSRCR